MISVVIIAKNAEREIALCLEALQGFPEVVVLDNESTDKTVEIARGFNNVTVHSHEFIGFGPLKNKAVDHATHDWILSVDCDEVLTGDLTREILNMNLDENCVYRMSRRSHYGLKRIRGCGWSPDWVLRLFNRKKTRFNAALVHESVMVPESMKTLSLKGILMHYPYSSVGELLNKTQFYSSLWADQNFGKLTPKPRDAVFHGLAAFLKGYVLRKGFIDGIEGFSICLTQGLSAYFKYMKLFEANRQNSRD